MISQRKRMLQAFLNRIARHPIISNEHVFHRFLDGEASWVRRPLDPSRHIDSRFRRSRCYIPPLFLWYQKTFSKPRHITQRNSTCPPPTQRFLLPRPLILYVYQTSGSWIPRRSQPNFPAI